MLESLEFKDFEPLVGRELPLQLGQYTFKMKVEAAELSKHQIADETKRRQAFSIYLKPLDDRRYPQETYQVTLPDFPEALGIFMVPVMGKKPGEYLMQAVFT